MSRRSRRRRLHRRLETRAEVGSKSKWAETEAGESSRRSRSWEVKEEEDSWDLTEAEMAEVAKVTAEEETGLGHMGSRRQCTLCRRSGTWTRP